MSDAIRRKIASARARIRRLADVAASLQSYDEYVGALDTRDIAERNLQVAIESCLDVGKMVIAALDLPEPSDNKGIFSVLAEAGCIGKASLSFLLPMAGTRNILVHGYDRIDDAFIYGILTRHLGDFETFFVEIARRCLPRIEVSRKPPSE